jgi:hypothetical protein
MSRGGGGGGNRSKQRRKLRTKRTKASGDLSRVHGAGLRSGPG